MCWNYSIFIHCHPIFLKYISKSHSKNLLSLHDSFQMTYHACISQSCPTLCDPMNCSPPGSSIQDFPGKNAGVGCHSLLQGIFPTQGSNPGLPYCRQTLYHLSHWGVLDHLWIYSTEIFFSWFILLVIFNWVSDIGVSDYETICLFLFFAGQKVNWFAFIQPKTNLLWGWTVFF